MLAGGLQWCGVVCWYVGRWATMVLYVGMLVGGLQWCCMLVGRRTIVLYVGMLVGELQWCCILVCW